MKRITIFIQWINNTLMCTHCIEILPQAMIRRYISNKFWEKKRQQASSFLDKLRQTISTIKLKVLSMPK